MNNAKPYISIQTMRTCRQKHSNVCFVHTAHIHSLTHITQKPKVGVSVRSHTIHLHGKAINESTVKHVLFMAKGDDENKLFFSRPACMITYHMHTQTLLLFDCKSETERERETENKSIKQNERIARREYDNCTVSTRSITHEKIKTGRQQKIIHTKRINVNIKTETTSPLLFV